MNKRPEAMTDQDRLLDIQMKLAPKTRIIDIITIAVMLIVIYAFAIMIYIIPDSEFSEQENRYLQQFPKISSEGKFLDRLVNGKFTSEIADYFSDQFPLRDKFVGLKAVSEISMFKNENNNVILGKNGYIIKRNGYPNYDMLDKNIGALTAFAEATSDIDIPYTIALAGRSEDVLSKYLPPLYPHDISERLWQYTDNALSSVDGLSYLNLYAPMKSMTGDDACPQIYYRTDHHWTTEGAYTAYKLLAPYLLGGTDNLPPTETFTIEKASESFYGTTWSSAGMKWIKPDTIQYYRYDGDENFITKIVDTGVSFRGFYDRSYLDKKDKYSSFIGGNNARADVYKVDADGNKIDGRPKMLLIKDSFAHSVAPFLARDYDLVILDLRYFKSSVKQLCIDEGISSVLVLVNIDSLLTANTFGILRMGL